LALRISLYLAMLPSVKASGTAVEINAQAFAATWKLASTTTIVITA
jgi:hypothetical protein